MLAAPGPMVYWSNRTLTLIYIIIEVGNNAYICVIGDVKKEG